MLHTTAPPVTLLKTSKLSSLPTIIHTDLRAEDNDQGVKEQIKDAMPEVKLFYINPLSEHF